MKTTTFVRPAAVAALLALALAQGSGTSAQGTPVAPGGRLTDLMILGGRGSEIGVRVTDGKEGGVIVEEVQPDSPAEKAGLKRSDVVIDFDGERVRGTRQFGRLVQETPPGRTVKATIVRDGQRKSIDIIPRDGRDGLDGHRFFDDDMLRNQQRELDRMRGQLPPAFNFRFDLPDVLSGRRLGVTVDELTGQLAEYFGTRDGVLVTAVTDGSVASRAGLKAGDVITSIDGQSVRSRDDLVRGLRDARGDEVKIGIVRDRKDNTVTAKIDAVAPRRGVRM